MEYNRETRLNAREDAREPTIVQHKGIAFELNFEQRDREVIYVVYPSFGSYDPRIRLTYNLILPDGEAVAEVTEEVLDFFHEQTLEKLFEIATSVHDQNINDWVGLDNAKD